MSVRSESSERADFAAELHEEVNRLPERYRGPIVLCHLEGLSNELAAGQLGLPVRTVQRRLARGGSAFVGGWSGGVSTRRWACLELDSRTKRLPERGSRRLCGRRPAWPRGWRLRQWPRQQSRS